MEDKILELAKRTGAKEREVKNLASAGFAGFCALLVAVIFGAGCVKTAPQSAQPAPQPAPEQSNAGAAQPPSQLTPAPTEQANTPPAAPKPGAEGPWPGYPAGTRYGTVSILDFRNA